LALAALAQLLAAILHQQEQVVLIQFLALSHQMVAAVVVQLIPVMALYA
jgi:hypothetical protein